MQFVTDSGTDLSLTSEQMRELNIHVVPLTVTLDGESYREGLDIEPEEFYRLLEASDSLPVTSQPSPGDLVDVYRQLAADPEIISIHISSGLSGAVNAAQLAAELVPEAKITVIDTKTLSAAAGWQVEAAARAAKAGWSKEKILGLMENISNASDSLYTLKELKYLIHGGRISHMKGLIASLLNIKPLIGVEKEGGTYVQLGQVRTFKRAMAGLAEQMVKQHGHGSALRVQVRHSNNPEGAAVLHDEVDKRFDCTWLPTETISLVLGAHTGPSLVAVAFAPQEAFSF
ncbi:MAG TPA: DegV family protein [candidate division Zixibacteria bacterium]|nr:DegV family protein [candidate division Zixibacteria bacterium]